MMKFNDAGSNKNKIIIIVMCLVGVALLSGGLIAYLIIFGIKSKPQNEYEVPSEYYAEYPDVEKYFEENSEVKSVIAVSKSRNIYSEKSISVELKNRGFIDFPITSDYSFEGKYTKPIEISDSSTSKHPVYETYYVTSNNKIWTISVIDGTIIATPSSYNVENSESIPVVVSESKEIVSYDSSKNQFYITIPNATTLNVRVIDRIDAQALESISLEG